MTGTGGISLAGPVLVTGAASGIGKAIVGRLTPEVAVLAVDRDVAGLARLHGEFGDSVHAVPGDLMEANAIDDLIERAWDLAGSIRGVVNCAGIYPVTPMLEMSIAEWDQVLALNLRAPFAVMRSVVQRMSDAKVGGSIVNVSSSASRLARPGIAHYGASKAGLNQLTANAAIEWAPHGIRVNAIAPGLIATENVMKYARAAGQAEHEAKLARIPIGREGQPEELVDLVQFLLSDASSYCTGGVFPADGGLTLGIPSY